MSLNSSWRSDAASDENWSEGRPVTNFFSFGGGDEVVGDGEESSISSGTSTVVEDDELTLEPFFVSSVGRWGIWVDRGSGSACEIGGG